MIPDQLDKFLISKIYENACDKIDSNTWVMTKEFAKLNNIKDVNNLYMCVKYRMRHYVSEGVFFQTKNGGNKNVYNMNSDKVILTKKRCSDGLKKGIWIRI